jgi:hypothetical protein
MVGSVMEKLEPEPLVSMCTGLGPFHAAVPEPCSTCSWVWSTAPVSASTSTVNRLGPSAFVPSTVDSQASLGVSSASTTSWVPSTPLTPATFVRATASASAAVSFGVTARAPTACRWATEVYRTCPAESVTTTKSPPTTRRPR